MTSHVLTGLVCLWIGAGAGIAAVVLAQAAARSARDVARARRPRCPVLCPVCADDALLDALRMGGDIPDEYLAHALAAWRGLHDIPGDSP